jgi:hypothetical protein
MRTCHSLISTTVAAQRPGREIPRFACTQARSPVLLMLNSPYKTLTLGLSSCAPPTFGLATSEALRSANNFRSGEVVLLWRT